jgi:hypothetical protein
VRQRFGGLWAEVAAGGEPVGGVLAAAADVGVCQWARDRAGPDNRPQHVTDDVVELGRLDDGDDHRGNTQQQHRSEGLTAGERHTDPDDEAAREPPLRGQPQRDQSERGRPRGVVAEFISAPARALDADLYGRTSQPRAPPNWDLGPHAMWHCFLYLVRTLGVSIQFCR